MSQHEKASGRSRPIVLTLLLLCGLLVAPMLSNALAGAADSGASTQAEADQPATYPLPPGGLTIFLPIIYGGQAEPTPTAPPTPTSTPTPTPSPTPEPPPPYP
jgi:hypothetical protein